MAEFKVFKQAVQQKIKSMTKNGAVLYTTDVDRDALWAHYLSSFPEGTNEMYKSRLEYDCTACKQFVRGIGNVVALVDLKPVSIWRVDVQLPSPFNVVAAALADMVEGGEISDRYLSEFSKIGVDSNKQLREDGNVRTWEHFFCQLPAAYVSSSVASSVASHRDSRALFQRALEEFTPDACRTVIELVKQGSTLYRGEENLKNLEALEAAKIEYDRVDRNLRSNWCWDRSHSNPIARIRNSALGKLLIDVSAGEPLEDAVFQFNKSMSPENYKRPTAVFSKRMVEDAQRKIEELGYTNSLERRFAVADDISVADVLFVDRSVRGRMVGGGATTSVFDSMIKEASVLPAADKLADKAEEVRVETFLSDVVKKGDVSGIELLVEGRHGVNFMSLIAPVHKDAPSMLKWSNNFGWAYNGDVADSMIKANVKSAGGKVDGVLRFSLQWNDGKDHNPNDFDAHCDEPGGDHIYFGNKGQVHRSSGMLDVDEQRPSKGQVAVENIVWSDKGKMPGGAYHLSVHNYSHNGGVSGFSAEVEFDGQLHQFSRTTGLRQGEVVKVAEVTLKKKDGSFSLRPLMESTVASRDVWGVKTQTFVPVSMMMLSPNHWEGQQGVGNKHYMFILKDCKNDGSPRGFFNEFLQNELTPHRKVFEALGARMRVEPSDDQLSGLGFSSTVSNSVVARVTSSKSSRLYKIVF